MSARLRLYVGHRRDGVRHRDLGVTSLLLWERITADRCSEQAIEEQRRLPEKTGRIVLAMGVVIFAVGVVLHQVRLA